MTYGNETIAREGNCSCLQTKLYPITGTERNVTMVLKLVLLAIRNSESRHKKNYEERKTKRAQIKTPAL